MASAFGLGFLAAMSACVYPLIPIVTAIFGATQVKHWYQGFGLAGLYVLGMAITYVAIAVVTALTGSVFGSYLGNPYVVLGFAAFFFFLGLMFLEIIPFPVPNIAEKFQVSKKSTIFYPFVLGIFSGFVAAPCTAPLFGKIIIDIAQHSAENQGGLTFPIVQGLSFSLGMGLPFLLVGGFSLKLPKPGRWMQAVKFLGATILFAAGLHYLEDVVEGGFPAQAAVNSLALVGLFLFVVFFVLSEPLKVSEGRPRKMTSSALLLLASMGLFLATSPFAVTQAAPHETVKGWHTKLDSALAAAKKDNNKVLIDLWAEWCQACFEMEAKLFTSKEFKKLVKDNKLVLARLDFTNESEENEKIARKYNIRGLPTLVLADSKGNFINSVIGFRSKRHSMNSLKYALRTKQPKHTHDVH